MGIAIGAEDSILDSTWIPVGSRGLFHDDNNAEYAAAPVSHRHLVSLAVANDGHSRAILNVKYALRGPTQEIT